jgi:hypothetical protein
MGTFQYALGALSGVLVGLLTDATPRGMSALIMIGAILALAADLARPSEGRRGD